jgi:catalase (peroxidase I)
MQYESPDGKLMMLPSDLALIQDETMKKWVELFAKDEGQFNKAFSVAFSKLLELGVTFPKTGIFGLGIGPL